MKRKKINNLLLLVSITVIVGLSIDYFLIRERFNEGIKKEMEEQFIDSPIPHNYINDFDSIRIIHHKNIQYNQFKSILKI